MEIIAETLSEAHEAAVDAVLNTSKAIEIMTSPDKGEKTIEFEAEDGSDEVITKERSGSRFGIACGVSIEI